MSGWASGVPPLEPKGMAPGSGPVPTTPPPPRTPPDLGVAGMEVIRLDLRSGAGTVSLVVDVRHTLLDDVDRDFVAEVVDGFRAYELGDPPPEEDPDVKAARVAEERRARLESRKPAKPPRDETVHSEECALITSDQACTCSP